MAEESKRSDKGREKENLEGPMASSRGSQMGMGGSEGLEGSYVQGAGNKSGMTSISSGYEATPERGSLGKGTGSKTRRTGDQTEPNR
ncbi:MAG: hypothetical protein ACE14P_09405 [Methanotrichaceae archaeon]